MPAEDVGGYEPVVHGEQEHLVPIGDGQHQYRSTCPCGPLQAVNVRGATSLPTWLHRSLTPA